MRKLARRREAPLVDSIAAPEDPEQEALRHVATEEVSSAMRNLTDLQRQVLDLRFATQLSIAETARVMERTEGAVKFLQHSALRTLQRNLVPEGVSSYGG